MTVNPSIPGIFRSAMSRSYGYMRIRSSAERPSGATSTSYSASASVFDSRSRMLASSSTTSTRGRVEPVAGRAGAAGSAARALAVEPRVDVALAKAPLAPDPDRRNLSGLDQAVDRAQVDLEVFQDFFRCQKGFVNH